MKIPEDLRYTKEHEWVKIEQGRATIGITDYAQEQLGDVVYVELPKQGATFEPMQPFGVVESVKAVSDLYCPLRGTVIESNEDLPRAPETINKDPYGAGWMIRIGIEGNGEAEDLLDAAAYRAYIDEERA